jgi:hypothetical protein
MRRINAAVAIAGAAMILCPLSARAAFIVEAFSPGKANANFSSLGHSTSSTPSLAPGLTAAGSVFGNPANATGPDQYTFSYTPGTDADNTVFAPLALIGDSIASDGDGSGATPPTYASAAILATGLSGGQSGMYRVFFTTPASTGVSATSLFEITNDGATVALNPVNLNTGGTSPPSGGSGANDGWLLVATVPLIAGNTYTLAMTASSPTFVSQRAHGVMWEYAGPIVPEPASLGLASFAAIGLALSGRRRKG